MNMDSSFYTKSEVITHIPKVSSWISKLLKLSGSLPSMVNEIKQKGWTD